MTQKSLKIDWNPGTWVLIWEYSARAFQWIPTWHGLDVFQKSLRSCALDESSLSIGRMKIWWALTSGLLMISPTSSLSYMTFLVEKGEGLGLLNWQAPLRESWGVESSSSPSSSSTENVCGYSFTTTLGQSKPSSFSAAALSSLPPWLIRAKDNGGSSGDIWNKPRRERKHI